MEFSRGTIGKSRRDKVSNETMRRTMDIKHDIIDDIKIKIETANVYLSQNQIPKNILN